jgi:hypothetical protein
MTYRNNRKDSDESTIIMISLTFISNLYNQSEWYVLISHPTKYQNTTPTHEFFPRRTQITANCQMYHLPLIWVPYNNSLSSLSIWTHHDGPQHRFVSSQIPLPPTDSMEHRHYWRANNESFDCSRSFSSFMEPEASLKCLHKYDGI